MAIAEQAASGGSSSVEMALFVGFLCMLGSTVLFFQMAKRFNYVAMAVTGIAAMVYCAMWCGAFRGCSV